VDWDYLPVTLEEVERIEVIRGTGGVLYGANAVNGVINIITRNPDSDPGFSINVKAGTQGVRQTASYAALESEDGKYRSSVFAAYDEDMGLGDDDGEDYIDHERLAMASTHNIIGLDEKTKVSLDARYRAGELGNPKVDTKHDGGALRPEVNILKARIEQQLDNGGQWYLQGYGWRQLLDLERDNDWRFYSESRVWDVEFQNVIPLEMLGAHRFIWGAGYREVDIRDEDLKDEQRGYYVWNAFLHDEWSFNEQMRLNAGVKLEHVSIVEPTWQWRVAFLYNPAPEHGLRFSVSNAYRSPTLSEAYYEVYMGLPEDMAPLMPMWPPDQEQFLWLIDGNDDLDPEQVVSYEVEYRGFWFDRVNFDLSYAYKQYENLISVYISDPGFYMYVPEPIGPLSRNIRYDDQGSAISNSIEVSIDAKLHEQLRLMANYGYVDLEISGDNAFEYFEENSARQMGRVGLAYSHPQGFMADVSGTYVDEVEINTISQPEADPFELDAYWRIDARVAHKFELKTGDLEIGVVGTNLGNEKHEEYVDVESTSEPWEIGTAYYGYVEYSIK
jgi:iron complex outermembrane receptor protein